MGIDTEKFGRVAGEVTADNAAPCLVYISALSSSNAAGAMFAQ